MKGGYTALNQTKTIVRAMQNKGVNNPRPEDIRQFRKIVNNAKKRNNASYVSRRCKTLREIENEALATQVNKIRSRKKNEERKKGRQKTRARAESKKKNKKKKPAFDLVIDHKPNPKPRPITANSLFRSLRSSFKPFKIVNIEPKALSRKSGSKRLISALVSNRFKQQMKGRTTRRATRRANTI